jgi:hypothetical protein
MFRVEWRELAQSRLADEWLKADSRLRAAITAVAHDIEQRLSRAPEKAGESREPGTRILIARPLTVTFHVNVRTRIVLISGVSVHRRRPPGQQED